MKTLRILLFLLFTAPIFSYAQSDDAKRVHDKGLQQQIKFTYGWEQYEVTTDSLYPHNWYWTFEHLLGNYIDGDYYPNYKETNLSRQYSLLTQIYTTKEKESMDSIYKKELAQDIYNIVDVAYLIEEAEILWRADTFNYYNNKIRELQLPESNNIANNMNNLFLESLDKVEAIKSSYIENHKRQEAYMQYEEEMDEVINYTKRLYRLMKLCKNSPFEH